MPRKRSKPPRLALATGPSFGGGRGWPHTAWAQHTARHSTAHVTRALALDVDLLVVRPAAGDFGGAVELFGEDEDGEPVREGQARERPDGVAALAQRRVMAGGAPDEK